MSFSSSIPTGVQPSFPERIRGEEKVVIDPKLPKVVIEMLNDSRIPPLGIELARMSNDIREPFMRIHHGAFEIIVKKMRGEI